MMSVSDIQAMYAAGGFQKSPYQLRAEALDRLEPIVTTLRTEGRLAASSRALHRQIGHALAARSRTTARVEAEDKPELLWDHPALERLHARLAEVDPPTALRLPPDLHAALHEAAAEGERTYNGEIVSRLRSTFKAKRSTSTQQKGQQS